MERHVMQQQRYDTVSSGEYANYHDYRSQRQQHHCTTPSLPAPQEHDCCCAAQQNDGCCTIWMAEPFWKFVKSIREIRGFVAFNIICIFQTIPALAYYISFFKKGWFLPYTAGMTPVWGATIGAIATVIVTSAVGPPLPNFISKSFCAAVIVWEFLCSLFLLIACVCLGVMQDYHGFGWAFVGSIGTGCAGVYLLWFATIFNPKDINPVETLSELSSPGAGGISSSSEPPTPEFAARRNTSTGTIALPPVAPAPAAISERDIFTSRYEPEEAEGISDGDVEMHFNDGNNDRMIGSGRRPRPVRLSAKDLPDDEIPVAAGANGTLQSETESRPSMAFDRLTPSLSSVMHKQLDVAEAVETAETAALTLEMADLHVEYQDQERELWRMSLPHDHTSSSPTQPDSVAAQLTALGYTANDDIATGRTYYHNTLTGVSQWHSPIVEPDLPPGFATHMDPSTGRAYYVHAEKGITTWDRPQRTYAAPLLPPPPPSIDGHPDSGASSVPPPPPIPARVVSLKMQPPPQTPERRSLPQQAPEKQPTKPCCSETTPLGFTAFAFIVIQCFLWAVLFVFAVIPVGFGVHSAMQVVEAVTYRAPGKLYTVSTALGDFSEVTSVSPATPASFLMHISCQGPDLTKYNRPTIVFESDNATSGYALIGLQTILADSTKSWRVCWYDRAGYGWSHQAPLGASSPAVTVARLNWLLVQSSEASNARGIILVGHGAGAELAQIYSATYPSQVRGLALLDGYSNMDRLQRVPNDDIFRSTSALCGTLEIGRALESVAIMRAVTDEHTRRLRASSNIFTPSQLLPTYLSTQTNGKFWAAMYSDLCVNKGSAAAATDFLSGLVRIGMTSGNLGDARWPQLKAGVPLLILTAGNTVTGTSNIARQSFRQAALYNATLSATNTTRWKVCANCDHSFAFDAKTAWIAGEIHDYFYRFI